MGPTADLRVSKRGKISYLRRESNCAKQPVVLKECRYVRSKCGCHYPTRGDDIHYNSQTFTKLLQWKYWLCIVDTVSSINRYGTYKVTMSQQFAPVRVVCIWPDRHNSTNVQRDRRQLVRHFYGTNLVRKSPRHSGLMQTNCFRDRRHKPPALISTATASPSAWQRRLFIQQTVELYWQMDEWNR